MKDLTKWNEASIYLYVPIGKTVTVNWGDGTIEEYTGSDNKIIDDWTEKEYNIKLEHTYSIDSKSANLKLEGYMTKFGCRYQLTSLDVSKNTALTHLSCNGDELTYLDVSKNTALTYLFCYGNSLTTLDVSKNTALTYFLCQGNKLTTLDVSKNTALTYLNCSYNSLTTLDITKNTALTELNCGYNQLTNLDVSKNTVLNIYFDCLENQLSASALNKIYTDLPQGKTWQDEKGEINQSILYATDNPGYEASNKNIATNKGWEIY